MTPALEAMLPKSKIPTKPALIDKAKRRAERLFKKTQRVIPQSPDERKVKSPEKPNKLIYPTRPTPHATVIAELLKRSVAR